jgi:4-aminobutyrate aminotransferase-like enzyme
VGDQDSAGRSAFERDETAVCISASSSFATTPPLEPATEETAAICDRLLELQPTGAFQNVLKIKPPLCVSRASVDYFADSPERVVTTGW